MTIGVACLDDVIAGLSVWHRAPRARCDDSWKREALGAVLAGVLLDLPGDLLLGPSWLRCAPRRPERGVADIDRPLQQRNLGPVFDGAQLLDDRRAPRATLAGPRHPVLGPPSSAPGSSRRSYRPARSLSACLRGLASPISRANHLSRPPADLEQREVGGLPLGLLEVAEVDGDEGAVHA